MNDEKMDVFACGCGGFGRFSCGIGTCGSGRCSGVRRTSGLRYVYGANGNHIGTPGFYSKFGVATRYADTGTFSDPTAL
jgi:hypothetical protein